MNKTVDHSLLNEEKRPYNWPMYIGFFLVSMVVLAFQTVINRMFSLMYWYHFAFMIISVAMFGIGLGGLLVFFFNRFLRKVVPQVLAVLSILLAVSLPVSLLQVNVIPLNMDLLGKDPLHTGYFIKVFLTLSVPFIISGFVFSYVFTNFKEDINRVYFFDLFGGGIGAIAVLFLFPGRGPFLSVYVLSVLASVAAAAFLYKRWKVAALIMLPILILANHLLFFKPMESTEVRVSKGKNRVEFTKNEGLAKNLEKQYGPRIFKDWDNFGFVAVHKSSDKVLLCTADYSCYTYFLKANKKSHYFEYPEYGDHFYPYVIKKKPGTVGIIGVGAGKDVLMTLNNGAREVYGAEFNATIFDLYRNKYAEFIGNVSRLSNVHTVKEEGRFFIRSKKRLYDLLIFDNAVAQTAVSSGAFTIAESYLYTVEAMMDYLSRLKPGGVIYFSNPYVDADRFVTVLREAFKRLKKESQWEESVFIVDNLSDKYRKCKVLIKNGGFAEEEIAKLSAFSERSGAKLLYAPGAVTKSYTEKLVRADDMEKEYADAPSEIRPSRDDWPFFTQRVKPHMKELNASAWNVKVYYPEPFLMLKQATKLVGFFAVLFLIVPLIVLNLGGFREMKNKFGSMLYFCSLGLGFMFLEIVYMQKFQLILGHPVYAFAVVLGGLLMSTGAGSLFSDRIKDPYQAIKMGLLGIAGSVVLSFLFLNYLGSSVVGFGFVGRILITLVFVALSGFFMGFMMPAGIRAVAKVESSIPWMWSLNSLFSVVASFLAIYISILFGFTAVMLLAIGIYLLGSGALLLRRN